jgi:hypothetical protein
VDSEGPSAELEAAPRYGAKRDGAHGPRACSTVSGLTGVLAGMLGLMPAIHLGVTELRF